jgi:hypothetical protein
VKVRITEKPKQTDLDGVSLDHLEPGAVREFSSSVASWLIAERYAEPEMRHDIRNDLADDFSAYLKEEPRPEPTDSPRRRSNDS